MSISVITRIQLCGEFVVVAGGRRVDGELPGRRGRLLLAYLATRRRSPVRREELIDHLWPGAAREPASASLTVVLSKVRAVIGHASLQGRSALRLALGEDVIIDVEAAALGLHEAESAIALRQWHRAWSRSLVALFPTRKPFLLGEDALWIDEERNRCELMHQRALACYAEACLGIGGTELPAAERAARLLVAREPLLETGHQLLMRALAARGEIGSALSAYETLRLNLASELGIDPSPTAQRLHRELLGSR